MLSLISKENAMVSLFTKDPDRSKKPLQALNSPIDKSHTYRSYFH